MTRAALAFTVTSLVPVPFLVAGALMGGVWAWLALLYMTAFAYCLDDLIAAASDDENCEFPAHNVLSVTLALAQLGLLGVVVAALSGQTGLPAGERLALFVATGLFMGQVGNSNAHELIHRAQRPLFALGKWVYISLLFGHHTSAHPLVHHRFVASDRDPSSARIGESYYRFARRAWIGSFREGLKAETARRTTTNRRDLHPYAVYIGGAAGFLVLSVLIGGLAGLVAYVALCAFAQSQLLVSDYVQHYGLRRKVMPDGKPEPVGPQHSWNAPHWYTRHMMLNAPRHSDHHAHPARPFPDLRLPGADEVPTLPRSLPTMAFLALFPKVWKRVMDPRVSRWMTPGTDRMAAE